MFVEESGQSDIEPAVPEDVEPVESVESMESVVSVESVESAETVERLIIFVCMSVSAVQPPLCNNINTCASRRHN